MKRKLLCLLCACVLLSGCRSGSEPTVQTQPRETTAAATQAATASVPLLEQGTGLEDSPNVLVIPNEIVEGMVGPRLRLLGNGLLLSEFRDPKLILNHISLEDGALLSFAAIDAGEETRITIGSGEIGLSDRERGLVTILDENLQPLRSYEVSAGGEDWYLNSDLDTLYIVYDDRGVLALRLETGEEAWLVENGFRVSVTDSANGYVFIEYTDREDQRTHYRCLDLSTATLETMPLNGASGIRLGDRWLLQKDESQVLILGEESRSLNGAECSFRLLSPRQHLLAMDASQRNLTLYDIDGAFRSRCTLPQSSHAAMGQDLVWSGYWEGYFFTDFLGENSRLMFWDVNAGTEGEDLPMEQTGNVQPPEPLLEPALYERAREISERYGVEICIGEQCTLNYGTYDSYALTDPVFVRSALELLDTCLGRYPEGFFRQIGYGTVEKIRFELVGALTIKDGIVTHPDSVGAFAHQQEDRHLIVLDGFLFREATLYHEISHVIDKKLDWDAQIRKDALFSEEAWLALQPEGFEFAMSYTDIPREHLAFADSGYFLTDYGMTFPTEDRAVLMEGAMEQEEWNFEPGFGTRKKLQFYADCIRDCFDTEGWPEVTCWEQVLND